MMLLLWMRIAHADPERIGARFDLGLGASTEGGLAVRLGLAPEVWWSHTAVALRVSFDGDLEAGLLDGEVDFLRIEPCALWVPASHVVVGAGIGVARATEHPGFSLFGSSTTTTQNVATGSIVAGWMNRSRWLGVWVRVDGTTLPTAAITTELTVAPGARLAGS
jgi:hypothetical protein